jgi:uncharacterized protein YceH (UPF0502 family)
MFEVAPGDPWTLAAVAALLAAVTVLAADGPARRAGRVDPIDAIRGAKWRTPWRTRCHGRAGAVSLRTADVTARRRPMHPPLTDVEVRVLGSLIEKEATTPDNYPLSMSALTAACNQTSNRDPVTQPDEEAITQAVVSLRRRGLLRAMQPAGSRVTKYSHLLADVVGVDTSELALLGVLMLRGPQTPGELHARTLRLADFADLRAVEAALDGLIARQPEALVVRQARRPGQKEVRYAHLLSGEPAAGDAAPAAASRASTTADSLPTDDDDRLAVLERTVEQLRAEVASLRVQFVEFRSQFQ